MSERRLLEIIAEECMRSSSHTASCSKVRERFGPNFRDVFVDLVRHGYVDAACKSEIALTRYGRSICSEALSPPLQHA